MVEIRVRRDDHGRIIPRCGECPRPHPDMQCTAENQATELWECLACGFTYERRKPAPPQRAILIDEWAAPN
jgi:hypothetical protein